MKIIINAPTIQYSIECNFKEIENDLSKHRISVAKINRKTKFLSLYLNDIDRFPTVLELYDKNINLSKFYNYMVEHYKLERLLYKAIIKNCNNLKKLYKIVINTKSKFKDLFNARLENIEEAMSNEYLNEGVYIYHNDGIKNMYNNTMKVFDILEQLNEPDITLTVN